MTTQIQKQIQKQIQTQIQELPLCVDLDDTLILTDSFFLQLKTMLCQKPLGLIAFCMHYAKGKRPAAKAWLAKQFPINPATLPYRQALLDYLHEQKKTGRRIYLVSAANQDTVTRVADYLKLFDGAYGSTNTTNLKAKNKAAFIIKNIAADFVYAGDAYADLHVWKEAKGAILCGKAIHFQANLDVQVEICFPNPRS